MTKLKLIKRQNTMDGPVLSISGAVLCWFETPPSSRNLRKSRAGGQISLAYAAGQKIEERHA